MKATGAPAEAVDRRLASGIAITAVAALALLAAAWVPWDWVPEGRLAVPAAGEVFSAADITAAEEFSAGQRRLGLISYFGSLAVAALLGFTRLGARVLNRLLSRRGWVLYVALGVLLLLTAGRLVTLVPAILIHRRNRIYGLSEQGWLSWSWDQVLTLGVAWLMTGLIALLVVATARRSPRRWFVPAAGIAAGLVVVGSYVYPVLVEPLFNRFTPLEPGELRQRVVALADREDVAVDEVLVADASRRTTTLNAYVSGFGSTRRVVLYDTLVRDMPVAQAEVIVAHELSHARHRDVLVGTAMGALGTIAGVAVLGLLLDSRRLRRIAGFGGPRDPAMIAVLLALVAVGSFATSPVQGSISRAIEARADREALAATGSLRTFEDMQRELALASLRDPTPPKLTQVWFGSHPTVLERIGVARVAAGGDR